MALKIKDYSLYLVISEEYGLGRNALEIAEAALAGGVDIIQMREKNKPPEELIKLGRGLAALCKKNNALFIVNDSPLIAQECAADGVHLGQKDLDKYSISKTRKIIGSGKIIGVSTHSLAEFQKANAEDVNYIAYGPVFPTQTKDYFIGTQGIKEVLLAAKKPVVFIGGINLINLDEILKEGAKTIAVIRAIIQSRDISANARAFKDKLKIHAKNRIFWAQHAVPLRRKKRK